MKTVKRVHIRAKRKKKEIAQHWHFKNRHPRAVYKKPTTAMLRRNVSWISITDI